MRKNLIALAIAAALSAPYSSAFDFELVQQKVLSRKFKGTRTHDRRKTKNMRKSLVRKPRSGFRGK